MSVERSWLDDPTFDIDEIFAELLEEIPPMKNPTVTFRLGLKVNDDAEDTLPEFEWPPSSLIWRNVPYVMVMEFQELMMDTIEMIQEETARWGVANSELKEKAGGDHDKFRQMTAQAAREAMRAKVEAQS